MKGFQIYLLGYIIFIGGLVAGLWKMGALERMGATWTAIAIVVAIGFGIMIAVSGSGGEKTT
jgi:hypothetical protein